MQVRILSGAEDNGMAIVVIPSVKHPGKILVATGKPGVELYTIEKAEILIRELQFAIEKSVYNAEKSGIIKE